MIVYWVIAMARKGKYIYNMYVDCGMVFQEGRKWHLKKEFLQFFSRTEAKEYEEMLKKKFKNVAVDEIELGKHKFPSAAEKGDGDWMIDVR